MRTVMGVVLAATMCSAQAQAGGLVCAVKAEATALETRVVQTELMVAALSCDAAARYNAFVVKFRPELTSAYKKLGGFFHRLYGSDVDKHVNDYVTRTANESSQRAIAQINDFCAAAALTFDLMEQADSKHFDSFVHAQPAAQQIGYDTCPEKQPKAPARRTLEANALARPSGSP